MKIDSREPGTLTGSKHPPPQPRSTEKTEERECGVAPVHTPRHRLPITQLQLFQRQTIRNNREPGLPFSHVMEVKGYRCSNEKDWYGLNTEGCSIVKENLPWIKE